MSAVISRHHDVLRPCLLYPREVLAALPFGNGLVTIDVGGIVLS